MDLSILGWGDAGWGDEFFFAALMTFAVALGAFLLGLVFGTIFAACKLSSSPVLRLIGEIYTTVLRGVPELLVIYLVFFGGGQLLQAIALRLFGYDGYIDLPVFGIGVLCIGLSAGAYSTEVIRGAVQAIPKGQLEAAHAIGMNGWLRFWRVLVPQAARYALPGLGNVWQFSLKDTSLISIIGLVEVMRTAAIGAGSTKQPFTFYITAFLIFLVLAMISQRAFVWAEIQGQSRRAEGLMDFELIASSFPKLLGGVDETLLLAASALVIGFGLAVPLALMSLSRNIVLRALAGGYVYVFRSTPLLVQIFLIYYGSGQFRAELESVGLWVLFRESWFCAIFAFSLNTAAYTSQIIRGGLQSVPHGQVEAARAVGMSSWTAFHRIVFPVAIRQALPAYGNEIILMVKATSLASTITIIEVTAVAKKIISATYQPIEVFLIAGAIYLGINFVLTRAVAFAEQRLSPHLESRPRAPSAPTPAVQR